MAQDVFITAGDIKDGVATAVEGFNSSDGCATAEYVAGCVSDGDTQAYFVPAVRLLLDASFVILDQPHVAEQLSSEVADRQDVASALVTHIGVKLTTSGYLAKLYRSRAVLRDAAVGVPETLSLEYPPYITQLGATPFYDARKVVGGALRLLQRDEVADPLPAIMRSRELLAISGVHRDYQAAAHEYLGNPYTSTDLLTLTSDSESPRVRFTAEACAGLRQFMVANRGCPAARITAGASGPSVLEQYWPKFVTYLAPENATATAA